MNRASLVLFALAALCSSPAAGQELIQNGSFECFTNCPDSSADIAFAVPWDMAHPTGSSDFLHPCSSSVFASAPTSSVGPQAAFDGVGYAGGAWYFGWPCYREFIQAPLLEPLVAGKAYRFTMRLSLAEVSELAIDSVGAHFTVGPLAPPDHCAPDIAPTVEGTPGVYWDDTSNWMEFTQTFVATGGEDYVTIGNFRSDTNTNTTAANPTVWVPNFEEAAYYFVDGVSLQPLTECADPPAGMVGWWMLDETAGTSAFEASMVHHASWVGAPIPGEGMVDGCYEFGLSMGHVEVPTHADLEVGTGAFSIDAWIRPAIIQNSPIVSKIDDADQSGVGYAMYLTDAGKIGVVIREPGAITVAESIDTVDVCAWNFVAVTIDRNDSDVGGRIYVNDQVTIFELPNIPGDITNAQAFRIGYQPVTTAAAPWEGHFEGAIDEVEFFTVEVPESDIHAIYAALSEGKCKPAIVDPGILTGPIATPITTGRLIKR